MCCINTTRGTQQTDPIPLSIGALNAQILLMFEAHQAAPQRFMATSPPLMSLQGSKPTRHFFFFFPSSHQRPY